MKMCPSASWFAIKSGNLISPAGGGMVDFGEYKTDMGVEFLSTGHCTNISDTVFHPQSHKIEGQRIKYPRQRGRLNSDSKFKLDIN